MTAPWAFVALVPCSLFGLVALLALRHRGLRPTAVGTAGTLAAIGGVAIGLGALALTIVDGTATSPTIGTAHLGLSVRLDALSATILAMIAVLAAVVFRYSRTYLDGNERQGAFLGRLAATIAAVELMVVAGNLVVLVVAWIATSLALHQLLVFHRDRPRAVVAARKKFVVARMGDVMLVAGTVVLYRTTGTGDLGEIFSQASASGATWALTGFGLAAVCLALAAALKSAQFPAHGWLVEVMETPTPVSALLHAGILNAGPFLALRMAYVLDLSRSATTVLLVVGATTAVFASVALLTQPSVKAALAYSSAAHMGFMLMVCGMGLYPAVLLHLVAHSFYKAHAFLASGSVIDEQRAADVLLPRRLGTPWRIAASAGLAMALYLPLAFLLGVDLVGEPVLVAVGAVLVLGTTQLIAPALDSAGPRRATVEAVAMAAGVTVAFFTLESGAHALLGSAVPELVGRAPVQLVLIGVILTAFAAVVLLQIVEPSRSPARWRQVLAIHLRNGLYANAVNDRLIGALRTAPGPAAVIGPAHEPTPEPALAAATTDTSSPARPDPMESKWN